MNYLIRAMILLFCLNAAAERPYPVVDTGQMRAYGDEAGQDAHYSGEAAAYQDHGDGTVSDRVTGLMWTKTPEKKSFEAALDGAKACRTGGYNDWRLPNAKELQSIVDYTRSPDATGSPAIDPVFDCAPIKNEAGKTDYAHYWTGTTHVGARRSDTAIYFAFGRGLGFMRDRRSGEYRLMDVHGAGCQRSDPKTGDAARFPHGRGPQGDVIRTENVVRCVRNSPPNNQ